MNYYEHHLGDWAKDTVHLTMLEEGAYRRLVDVYYVKEKPLPKAIRDIYKLARAGAKPERDAVDSVLREFFQEREDGWHHKRCDEELARYSEGQEEAEGKRENDKERQRRARERRKHLFEQLRGHGIVPAWDTKTSDLEAQLSRVTEATGHATSHTPVTPPVTRDNTATRHQTPDTSNQTPDLETGEIDGTAQQDGPSPRPSMASAICLALKAEGIGIVSPGHPRLAELIAAGAEVQHFVDAARSTSGRSKGFAYILGIVDGQLADARQLAAAGRTKTKPVNGYSGNAARAARMAEACPTLVNGHAPDADFIDTEALDVTPRRVG